jgi:beta-lactamase class A
MAAVILLLLPVAVLVVSGALSQPAPAVDLTSSQASLNGSVSALGAGAAGPTDSQVAWSGPVKPAGWAKAPLLEAAVEEAMADFPGAYSVVVQELDSNHRWTVNPDRPYHPASTIKLPVVLYALEQYRAGKVGWQDVVQYTPADFERPGGGAFETAPFGGWYPIENLVNRALMYSNNVAVNMLLRHFGREEIEAWTKTIGGDLYWEDGSPRVTALSELGWWLHLDKLSREDPTSAELLLTPLRQVAYHGRIAAGLPDGVKYLHKFGSYDGNFHDGGIIYAERPYVLVVLTYGAREDEADAAIAAVSAAVYRVMTSQGT